MQRRDGGLELVDTDRAAGPEAYRTLQQLHALLDGGPVPQRAILFFEKHQLAVAHARITAGVVQEHESKQRVDVRLVWHQRQQDSAKPDCLRAEAAADEAVTHG